MNIIEIAALVFPGSFVGSDNSISGLEYDTVPQNCVIHMEGRATGEKNRIFYIIEGEGFVAYLRIADAAPDSGYDKFAVIHCLDITDERNYTLNNLITRMEYAKELFGERFNI